MHYGGLRYFCYPSCFFAHVWERRLFSALSILPQAAHRLRRFFSYIAGAIPSCSFFAPTLRGKSRARLAGLVACAPRAETPKRPPSASRPRPTGCRWFTGRMAYRPPFHSSLLCRNALGLFRFLSKKAPGARRGPQATFRFRKRDKRLHILLKQQWIAVREAQLARMAAFGKRLVARSPANSFPNHWFQTHHAKGWRISVCAPIHAAARRGNMALLSPQKTEGSSQRWAKTRPVLLLEKTVFRPGLQCCPLRKWWGRRKPPGLVFRFCRGCGS